VAAIWISPVPEHGDRSSIPGELSCSYIQKQFVIRVGGVTGPSPVAPNGARLVALHRVGCRQAIVEQAGTRDQTGRGFLFRMDGSCRI